MLIKGFEVIFRDLENMSYFVSNSYYDLKNKASKSEVDLHVWNEFISDYPEKEKDLTFLQDELVFQGVFRKATNKDELSKKFIANHLHNLLANFYIFHFEHITKTGFQEAKKTTKLLSDLEVAMIKSMASNPSTRSIPIYDEMAKDKVDPYNGLYD